jgi:hypothetical protein
MGSREWPVPRSCATTAGFWERGGVMTADPRLKRSVAIRAMDATNRSHGRLYSDPPYPWEPSRKRKSPGGSAQARSVRVNDNFLENT